MAIVSVGYDGPVDEVGFSRMIPSVGASEYGVVGENDWVLTPHPTTAQAVNLSIGRGWGYGVYDESDTVATVQCDPITSGSRWDLIVADRDWQPATGVTKFLPVAGGTTKALPARIKGPGVHDQQPLWLVQWTAGQTQPTGIVDLRAWAGNGGMVARDELVRTYLVRVGTRIVINGIRWIYTLGTNNMPQWVIEGKDGAAALFATGNALLGDWGTAGGQFLVQAGTAVSSTDGAGFGRLYWPKPFPTGLLTVLIWNGDGWASGPGVTISAAGTATLNGQPNFWGTAGAGNKTEIVFEARNADGSAATNRSCRLNYIALGW